MARKDISIKASDVVKTMTLKINVEGMKAMKFKLWLCSLVSMSVSKFIGCKVELVGDDKEPRMFLYPGMVKSRTDSDSHFICSRQLAYLYGVDVRDCIVISGGNDAQRGCIRTNQGDLHLMPREDGQYSDPHINKEFC